MYKQLPSERYKSAIYFLSAQKCYQDTQALLNSSSIPGVDTKKQLKIMKNVLNEMFSKLDLREQRFIADSQAGRTAGVQDWHADILGIENAAHILFDCQDLAPRILLDRISDFLKMRDHEYKTSYNRSLKCRTKRPPLIKPQPLTIS